MKYITRHLPITPGTVVDQVYYRTLQYSRYHYGPGVSKDITHQLQVLLRTKCITKHLPKTPGTVGDQVYYRTPPLLHVPLWTRCIQSKDITHQLQALLRTKCITRHLTIIPGTVMDQVYHRTPPPNSRRNPTNKAKSTLFLLSRPVAPTIFTVSPEHAK